MPEMASWKEAQTQYAALLKSLGGDLPPLRAITDPYPTFNGIALDTQNGRVLISDENRKSVLLYDRAGGSQSPLVTRPLRQILGPRTGVGFIAGVEMDPERRELYAVNNDIEDRVVIFDYNAQGNVEPKRTL